MNDYIALTNETDGSPALFVKTSAPLNTLLDAANYRIRAVTQVLENLAMRSEITTDSVVLSDFAQLICIPLRDGCDLLNVIAQRLDLERPNSAARE
ncbi:short-chain dehydrogenase [Pseudomonas fluorescens]|uniref:Short-chain dehydrogenase n=1 Tax=Pseudomonas fluorescens TaxID=294 RepID=A0A4Y9TL68_PSEFL|nr:short-chain dehydrogenase [Pseudomonas fluorescens]TFW43146.1 short-chain dehydrogenase [Pseudomonas fluorescens]